MEIGRYHWMYPGSKNHQYRPVPTLGDRANPLSSPGKYSLGVHSHSNSTVIFNMICDSSFGLVLFFVLLDAFICSQGLGWKWPFKHCFHHLSFSLFLSIPPHLSPLSSGNFMRLYIYNLPGKKTLVEYMTNEHLRSIHHIPCPVLGSRHV